MAVKPVYSAEQHRIAFEAWFQTRSWTEAARSIGCSYPTPAKWATNLYVCEYGCPWHDWDSLIREREASAQAQLDLISGGNVNPLEQEKALQVPNFPLPGTFSPAHSRQEKQKLALVGIHKSDLERLAQYELLYNKIFFDLTGVTLSYGIYKDADGKTINFREIYATKGMRGEGQSKCIASLNSVLDQIEKLRRKLGLDNPPPTPEEELAAEKEKTEKKLTLQDLRNMQAKLQNTPEDQLQAMAQIMKSERQTLENASSE